MRFALAAGVLAAVVRLAVAAPLGAGDALPPITGMDQHDKPIAVDAHTRVVLVTRDMDGGALVREALATDGAQRLADAHAVYVADVSRMPTLVLNFFALPKLRDRPYPILLDREGTVTRDLPGTDGAATVLLIEGGKIGRVTEARSMDEVRAALAAH